MAIINKAVKKYFIKQRLNDNNGNTVLQPLYPATIASQLIQENSGRLLGQTNFILGSTFLLGWNSGVSITTATIAPEDPDIGDQYFNETTNKLFTYTEDLEWSGVVLPVEQPQDPTFGTRWFDETTDKLFTYVNTLATGTTGNWTTTIQQGVQTGNISLTLPNVEGTIALTSDLPTLSTSSNLLSNSYNAGAITFEPFSASTADSTWVGDDANAGKLYLGTVNPSKATRLNYNGSLYTKSLFVDGSAVITNATYVDPTLQNVLTQGNTTNLGLTISEDADGTGDKYFEIIPGDLFFVDKTDIVLFSASIAGGFATTGQTGTKRAILAAIQQDLVEDVLVPTTKAEVEVTGDTSSGNVKITAATEIDLTTPTVDINTTSGTTIDVAGASSSTSATNLTLAAANSGTDGNATASVLISAKTEIDLTAPTIDINGSTTVDIDGGTITIDGTSLSLDGTLSSNLTVTGVSGSTSATNLTLTAANSGTHVDATANVLVTAKTEIDLTAAIVDINTTSGTTIDVTGASGSTSATNLTLTAANSGVHVDATANVLISAKTEIDLTAPTIDINGAVDISGALVIGGDLTVNGTTTTINSTQKTLDDPILTLGGDTSTVEATKDRGIEAKYNGTTLTITNYIGNGTTTVTGTVASTAGFAAGDIITISGAVGAQQEKLNGTWKINTVNTGNNTFTFTVSSSVASGTLTSGLGATVKSKNAFFGLDQSTGFFTFIPQGNNTSEVFAGTKGTIDVSGIRNSTGTLNIGASSSSNTSINGTLTVSGNSSSIHQISGGGFFLIDSDVDIARNFTATLGYSRLVQNRTTGNSVSQEFGSKNSGTGADPIVKIFADSSFDGGNGTATVEIYAQTGAGSTGDGTVKITADNIEINGSTVVDGDFNADTFNDLTLTSQTNGFTIAGGTGVSSSRTVDINAGLTVGSDTNTGTITLTSNNTTARSLTLNSDSIITGLTANHVLYASAVNTISGEAQLAVSRGGTGVASVDSNTIFAGSATVPAATIVGSFTVGTTYKITTLGTTTQANWNTIAGTTGVTYTVGSIFTAASTGTGLGDGTATAFAAPSFRSLVNADLPNSGVIAGTYSTVSVNSKGIATAGGQLIEIGGATPSPTYGLVVGGLFFEEIGV